VFLKVRRPLRGSQGREGSQGVWSLSPVCHSHGHSTHSTPPRDSRALSPETVPGERLFNVSKVFWRGCVNSVTGVSGPPKPSPAGWDSFSLENPFSHHPGAAGALAGGKAARRRLPKRIRTTASVGASHLNSRGRRAYRLMSKKLGLAFEEEESPWLQREDTLLLPTAPSTHSSHPSGSLSHLKVPTPLHTRPIATFRTYSASTIHKPSQYTRADQMVPPTNTCAPQSLEPTAPSLHNVIK